MLIKQLLHEAFTDDDINLQALIMFLVFEKQVMTMEDDQSALRLYFLPKHEQRMGEELTKYKRKMKMIEKTRCFKVFTSERETLYIYANSAIETKGYACSLNYNPISIEHLYDDIVTSGGTNVAVSDITRNRKIPSLLGQNKIEMKYKWRNLP